jgi:hypothetical protein
MGMNGAPAILPARQEVVFVAVAGKAAVPALQQAVLIDLNRRRRTERKQRRIRASELEEIHLGRPDNETNGQRTNDRRLLAGADARAVGK